jgi:hypothetical protein
MNDWHKSSYSPNGSNCVEVAEGATTAVRDSKHPEHAMLAVPAVEWTALVDSLKSHA